MCALDFDPAGDFVELVRGGSVVHDPAHNFLVLSILSTTLDFVFFPLFGVQAFPLRRGFELEGRLKGKTHGRYIAVQILSKNDLRSDHA